MYCVFEFKFDFIILFCKFVWLYWLDFKSFFNFSVFIYFLIKMRCIIIFVEIKYVKEYYYWMLIIFVFYCNVLFIFFKIKILNVNNFVI